jgi:hypothetical protein
MLEKWEMPGVKEELPKGRCINEKAPGKKVTEGFDIGKKLAFVRLPSSS